MPSSPFNSGGENNSSKFELTVDQPGIRRLGHIGKHIANHLSVEDGSYQNANSVFLQRQWHASLGGTLSKKFTKRIVKDMHLRCQVKKSTQGVPLVVLNVGTVLWCTSAYFLPMFATQPVLFATLHANGHAMRAVWKFCSRRPRGVSSHSNKGSQCQ